MNSILLRFFSSYNNSKNDYSNLKERLDLNFSNSDIESKTNIINNYIKKGIQAENSNDVKLAIEYFENAIHLKFEGSYPYRRLAILYRKRKMYADEIRVLKKAVSILKGKAVGKKINISNRIEEYELRLQNALYLDKIHRTS